MKLHSTISGEPGPLPPVLLVHGLFGSGRNLGVIARRLAHRRVIQVDMRNHGDSPWSDDHDYPAMAGDLAEVIAAEGASADVIGHSMGGKAAMVLALIRPDLVRRLVVMDIAPMTYLHDKHALIAAMQAVDPARVSRRSDADRQLATRDIDAGTRGFLLQSLDLASDPPRWKFNLDVLDAAMGAVMGWPEGVVTPAAFPGPVLSLSGARSDYVDESARTAFRHWFPQATFASIADCGHWLHAEKPNEVGEAIAAFVDQP